MTLRWREEHGEYILESSFPLLGTRGPRIAPSGFEAGCYGADDGTGKPSRQLHGTVWL